MLMVPFNIYVLPSIGSIWDCQHVSSCTLSGKLSSDGPCGRFFCASTSAEASSSKDSFFRLLAKPKVVLICYVIFTLSAGLGFLDATLSLFAINTVNTILLIVHYSLREQICAHHSVCLIIFFITLCQFKLSPGSVGLIMLGLSLPYCLASPVLGFIADKYPVSLNVNLYISIYVCVWVFLVLFCFSYNVLCVCRCPSGHPGLVYGHRGYNHSYWFLSTWSGSLPAYSKVSTG